MSKNSTFPSDVDLAFANSAKLEPDSGNKWSLDTVHEECFKEND